MDMDQSVFRIERFFRSLFLAGQNPQEVEKDQYDRSFVHDHDDAKVGDTQDHGLVEPEPRCPGSTRGLVG